MDHGNNSNSMRFFVSRHLVPPAPASSSRPGLDSSSSSRPVLDSLIWTTSSPATYGISSSNNHNSSPVSSGNNSHMNNFSSSSQPVINGSKTRIEYQSMFPSSRIGSRAGTMSTVAGGNHLMAPRDRKPLQSPEYEIPSVSGSRTGSSSSSSSAAHHLPQRMMTQQKQISSSSQKQISSSSSSSHLNNPQQESVCVNSSYNVHYGALTHQGQDGDDRDLLGDEIILGSNSTGTSQPLTGMSQPLTSDGSRVKTDLMMATPEAVRSGSCDLSIDRLSPSSSTSNSMNHPRDTVLIGSDTVLIGSDTLMIGSDHESSPEHSHHECKSNQYNSESHIYSHIYDPSTCSCPSCDRVTNSGSSSSRTRIMTSLLHDQYSSNTSQLCHDLTSSSVLRTGYGHQPVLTLPSYHDKMVTSGKKKTKRGKGSNQTQHNISLATLHKLNNLKPSSPDFLSHRVETLHDHPPSYLAGNHPPSYLAGNHPPSYLAGMGLHLGGSLSPYSSPYNLPSISPITFAKDRRKKCFLLSAALALLVLLVLLLVTSFVVFIVTSYQSYYSASSASIAATYTGTSSTPVPSTPPFYGRIPHPVYQENSSFDDHRSLIPDHQPDLSPSTASPSITNPATSASLANGQSPSSSSSVPVDQPIMSSSVPVDQPVMLSHYDEEEEEQNCREGEEWRCRDGLCVPKDKRCDGHFNCFDHSDEFDCDPCPTFDGFFHCGNNTSCLHPSKKCDGVYNCWDGADEHGCDSYVHDGYTT